MKCTSTRVCVCACLCMRERERSSCPQDPSVSLPFALCQLAVSQPTAEIWGEYLADSGKAKQKQNRPSDYQIWGSHWVGILEPSFNWDLSMVLTTSFPHAPPSSVSKAASKGGGDVSAGVLGPEKPPAERVEAVRTYSVRLGLVLGAGAGALWTPHLFRIPARGAVGEAGWGRGGVTCRRQWRPGKVPFLPRARGAPPHPRPPRPRLPQAAQPGDCGANPAQLHSPAAPARPPPARPLAAPAIQLVRSRASTSWRLKVSGGRPWLVRRAEAQVAGARRCTRGRGEDGAGRAAVEAQGPRMRPGRRVGGAAPRVLPTLAGPGCSVGLGPWPGAERSWSGWQVWCQGRCLLLAARSGAPVRPCRPGGTGWGSEGPQGVPPSIDLASASHPPTIPAFLPNWEPSFAVPVLTLLSPYCGVDAGLYSPSVSLLIAVVGDQEIWSGVYFLLKCFFPLTLKTVFSLRRGINTSLQQTHTLRILHIYQSFKCYSDMNTHIFKKVA